MHVYEQIDRNTGKQFNAKVAVIHMPKTCFAELPLLTTTVHFFHVVCQVDLQGERSDVGLASYASDVGCGMGSREASLSEQQITGTFGLFHGRPCCCSVLLQGGRVIFPEGPSTHYSRTPVPNSIKGIVFGTRDLMYWVLGPLGYRWPATHLRKEAQDSTGGHRPDAKDACAQEAPAQVKSLRFQE